MPRPEASPAAAHAVAEGPASAPVTAAPPGPGTAALAAVGVLLAVLLLLRRPDCLTNPQFWAEDGTLFFQEAHNRGFLATVLQPAAGYHHLFPRLMAGLALLAPLERAPLVFNVAAFAVQLLPALLLIGPRMAPIVPSFAARAVAAALIVAAPAAGESYVNVTNSHWFLALAVVCALYAAPAVSAAARALEAAAALLFSMSSPVSVPLLPLAVARLVRGLRGGLPRRELVVPGIVAAGAAVQIATVLGSARVGGPATPWERLSLPEALTVLSLHGFYNPVLGASLVARIYRGLPALAHAFALFALAALVWVALRDRHRPLLVVGYLAATTIATAFAFPLSDPRLWLHPASGPRYFVFSGVFVLLALLHLALRRGALRAVGVALLPVALLAGVPADYRLPRLSDVQWPRQAAVLRALPEGAQFYVPMNPLYHGGMTLRRRPGPTAPSPLERLRPLPGGAAAALAVGRPAEVYMTRSRNETFLSVNGWTGDAPARGPGGAIFVQIDDRLFPAVRRLSSPSGPGGGPCRDCGFARLIPAAEIGPGAHEASVVVVAPDGEGYYRPAALSFTTEQFFP